MGLKDELVVVNDPKEEPEEEEDEPELEDPKETITTECQQDAHCAKYAAELAKCTERVESKSDTTETCEQELYDFIHCVDHCVSSRLFPKLK